MKDFRQQIAIKEYKKENVKSYPKSCNFGMFMNQTLFDSKNYFNGVSFTSCKRQLESG